MEEIYKLTHDQYMHIIKHEFHYNGILTKKGEVHLYSNWLHPVIIGKNRIKGEDWIDWVRILVIKHEGTWRPIIRYYVYDTLPEWLEREYGHYMKEIMKKAKKLFPLIIP